MIENIVFDMGKVLIQFDVDHYLSYFADAPEDRELLRREVFRSVEWIQLDRGTVTDTEAVRLICKRLPERLHQAVEDIFARWHRDIPPLGGVYDLVSDLKQAGYHLYLLSNTSVRFHEFRKNIAALKFFDGEFISADCGLLKPELEIYQKFFEKFSLDPAKCIFIDDAPANIEASYRAGMPGIVYNDDPEELRGKLRAFGVKC